MNIYLIFSIALVLLGPFSQLPIISFAIKNKGKQNYRNTLLMTLYIMIMHGLVIYINFIEDFDQFILIWGLVCSIFTFNIGRNYINTKELTNIEVELNNRLFIALPIGMAVYIALFNLRNETEIMIFIVIPIALIIGCITMILNFRRLNTIRNKTDAIFWKKIHYINSLMLILLGIFSIHIIANHRVSTGRMVLSSMLLLSDLISLISISIKKGESK